MKASTIRAWSRLHKIFGLVIGLQVLFWMASGFYFTLYPIENIRGDHLRAEIDHGKLEASEVTLTVQEAIDASSIWAFQAELKMFMKRPVWKVSNSHDTRLIDAMTGEKISPISEGLARAIVTEGVPGLAKDNGTYFLLEENAPREYGGRLPVWVFETEGAGERVYLDPMTAEIRAVRTTEWRIFDVFWRFHIMDVTGDDRFDSWWMKLAAFLGLAITITGFAILYHRLIRGRLFS